MHYLTRENLNLLPCGYSILLKRHVQQEFYFSVWVPAASVAGAHTCASEF